MARIKISPKFTEEKLDNPTVEDLIDVFEDRIKFWLLEPSKQLMQTEIGWVPGFSLLLSYFEGIWIYTSGKDSKNKSKEFFRKAFLDVFRASGLSEPLLDRIGALLYEDARCGFFHDCIFRGRTFFASINQAEMLITLPKKDGKIDETGAIQSIFIDVQKSHDTVSKHFATFISRLRNPTEIELRKSFYEICRVKWGFDQPGIFIGLHEPKALDDTTKRYL
jgi:hypothetical protein